MIVAIIPARSGSKGFPHKNIKSINGRTLLEYAVRSGVDAKLVDRVLISTDSGLYEKIAITSGAESLGLRKDSLASDDAKTIDVIEDVLNHSELKGVTHIVLLQPTSPIRDGKMIDECIKLSLENQESVVTLYKVDEPHPLKLKKIINGRVQSYIDESSSELNRQDLSDVYGLTGSIYVSSVDNIKLNRSLFSENTIPYVSDKFVNIDSASDFEYLEFLVSIGAVELP